MWKTTSLTRINMTNPRHKLHINRNPASQASHTQSHSPTPVRNTTLNKLSKDPIPTRMPKQNTPLDTVLAFKNKHNKTHLHNVSMFP